MLERTTVYVWRRHLAAEAGRALLPATRRQRRQRRVHSYRPRPAPVPAPASACTAHLPAAPNPAPGAYRPHPMTGARWRGGVNPAELVPAVVSDQAR